MDASSENDIPPLSFDTEREVLDVLARLRRELERRVNVDDESSTAAQALEASQPPARVKGKGKGKAGTATMSDADRQRVHELVVQQFFDKMQPIILSNCSIGGVPYAEYVQLKESGEHVETQPFSEELNRRVLINQDALFDAREANIRKRKEDPAMAAAAVKEIVDADVKRVTELEQVELKFPEPKLPQSTQSRGRKSIGGAKAEDGPTLQQAQDDFDRSKSIIDALLKDVPKLSASAEEATKVALDAAMVE